MRERDRSAESPVQLTVAGRVATLWLNRPAKRNALSRDMVGALLNRLDQIDADPGIHVVSIRGVGDDFSAGADLAEIEATQRRGPEAGLKDARLLGSVFSRIRRVRQPVAAVVTGRALGGGCGLATACDIVLVQDDAVLGFPEVHLGFVPALVAVVLRGKIGAAASFELLVLGERLDGIQAVACGLATRSWPAPTFESSVQEYLAGLARRPRGAVRWTKRLFHGLDARQFDGAIDRAAELNALARLTDECKEGIRGFLDGRRATCPDRSREGQA